MNHDTQNIARQHAIAARKALDAFRKPEAGLDWSSFDTAVGLLDQTIEELRRPVRSLPPTLLGAGGLPAAIAYVLEEIQAADGFDMESREYADDADQFPPKWKQAAVRITQESLANACRHSKSKRLFLELTLAGNVLRIDARDWGVGFKPDGIAPGRFGLDRTCRRLKLLGGTATIDTERGKGTYVTIEIPFFRRGEADRLGQVKSNRRRRLGEG